jgi:hypothetical protein
MKFVVVIGYKFTCKFRIIYCLHVNSYKYDKVIKL